MRLYGFLLHQKRPDRWIPSPGSGSWAQLIWAFPAIVEPSSSVHFSAPQCLCTLSGSAFSLFVFLSAGFQLWSASQYFPWSSSIAGMLSVRFQLSVTSNSPFMVPSRPPLIRLGRTDSMVSYVEHTSTFMLNCIYTTHRLCVTNSMSYGWTNTGATLCIALRGQRMFQMANQIAHCSARWFLCTTA